MKIEAYRERLDVFEETSRLTSDIPTSYYDGDNIYLTLIAGVCDLPINTRTGTIYSIHGEWMLFYDEEIGETYEVYYDLIEVIERVNK